MKNKGQPYDKTIGCTIELLVFIVLMIPQSYFVIWQCDSINSYIPSLTMKISSKGSVHITILETFRWFPAYFVKFIWSISEIYAWLLWLRESKCHLMHFKPSYPGKLTTYCPLLPNALHCPCLSTSTHGCCCQSVVGLSSVDKSPCGWNCYY